MPASFISDRRSLLLDAGGPLVLAGAATIGALVSLKQWGAGVCVHARAVCVCVSVCGISWPWL